MAKKSLEIAVSLDYIRGWGIWEGVREMVQNALDSNDDGYPMDISHENGYLVLRNRHCRLGHNVWVFGVTSKRNTYGQRGTHGDGLKAGTVALLRAGVEVFFHNADEIWRPCVEASEQFDGEEILKVKVRKRRADSWGDRPDEDFACYIKISKKQWEEFQGRFLDLKDDDHLYGIYPSKILNTPEEKGNIYCKGVWVCRRDDLAVGYNLNNLDLDRDRRVVDEWDLKWEIANLWRTQMKDSDNKDDMIQNAYNLLNAGEANDLGRLASKLDPSWDANCAQITGAFQARFVEDYGEKAVPVTNADEASKVEHFGLKGIVVPQDLHKVLQHSFGTTEEILKKAVNDNGCYVTLDELTDSERQNVKKAFNLLYLADVVSLDRLERTVKVFAYRSPDAPLGTYHANKLEDGVAEIRINHNQVGSLKAFLGTLIHELAHDYGRDGSKGHVSKEEQIWRSVFGTMAEMAGTDWLLD